MLICLSFQFWYINLQLLCICAKFYNRFEAANTVGRAAFGHDGNFMDAVCPKYKAHFQMASSNKTTRTASVHFTAYIFSIVIFFMWDIRVEQIHTCPPPILQLKHASMVMHFSQTRMRELNEKTTDPFSIR